VGRQNADLLDPASWTKLREPVLQTCYDHGVYGPGHNSFTVARMAKP
jgi:GH43 family beta-xylosidase